MGEGGIIGKLNPSTSTSGSGIWSTNEVFLRNTVAGEWPNFNAPSSVSYNLLGGGGGSADSTSYRAIGGGAGSSLVQGTFAPTGGTTYTVTIGAGGIGENDGGTSSIVGIVNAPGGGHGTSSSSGNGGYNTDYNGGGNTSHGGGGGAGAGANGQAGYSDWYGGYGGDGVTLPLHPTGLTVGGGGGGGGHFSSGGGGSGGGGMQANGTANTGGGGGGIREYPKNGGSGRVILRYPDSSPAATATTGSVTVTVSGGYRHYDFTSSGSIIF